MSNSTLGGCKLPNLELKIELYPPCRGNEVNKIARNSFQRTQTNRAAVGILRQGVGAYFIFWIEKKSVEAKVREQSILSRSLQAGLEQS